MKNIKDILFPIHTHAEIVYDQKPSQIVYRERDVIAAIKEAMIIAVNEVVDKRMELFNTWQNEQVYKNEEAIEVFKKQIQDQ